MPIGGAPRAVPLWYFQYYGKPISWCEIVLMNLARALGFGSTFYLALCALLIWTHRRHRKARKYRQAVADALMVQDEPGRPYLVC